MESGRFGLEEYTVSGIIEQGSKFYYWKLRADLEHGSGLNQTWYTWRRGGDKQMWQKDHGWRSAQGMGVKPGSLRGLGRLDPPPRRRRGVTGAKETGAGAAQHAMQQGQPERTTEVTLKVPYPVGSELRDRVQRVEDEYSTLIGCRKIRVVEGGGYKLIHTLGHNNPWAARQRCDDEGCKTCSSRMWIRERFKAARKRGAKPPKIFI